MSLEKKVAIRVVLGTMNMARQVDKSAAIEQIDIFLDTLQEEKASKSVELDTALMYPSRETEGLTEQLLRDIYQTKPDWKDLYIATKANPCNYQLLVCIIVCLYVDIYNHCLLCHIV
jgi:aryl-alcohol dehydrogenase-like predicted oxidoreductase